MGAEKLSLRGVVVRRRDREILRVAAIDVLDGEVLAIIGPNGAGKTTLLQVLGLLLRPTHGAIRIVGYDLFTQPIEIKRRIGVLPEELNLYERLSGEENSLLAERLKALDSKIEQNEEKIALMDERLDSQRERLYLDFYRLELTIAKLQANLSALESVQVMPLYILGETD